MGNLGVLINVNRVAASSVEDFVQAYGAGLARLCFQLTGTHDASLDLVQDVLELVHAKWSKVAAADHPYAYVRRMTLNKHLNNSRRRIPTVATDPILLDHQSEPTTRGDDLMWQALAGLPTRQRAALVLRYYEDCTEAEIASTLGCRPATVRSLVSRGLAALRTSDLLRSES